MPMPEKIETVCNGRKMVPFRVVAGPIGRVAPDRCSAGRTEEESECGDCWT
jgi:hypothetical protein